MSTRASKYSMAAGYTVGLAPGDKASRLFFHLDVLFLDEIMLRDIFKEVPCSLK